MFILLPLLRRVRVRTRIVIGVVLLAVGLGVAAGGLAVTGAITFVVGAIFLGHGLVSQRRHQAEGAALR